MMVCISTGPMRYTFSGYDTICKLRTDVALTFEQSGLPLHRYPYASFQGAR
jgi:hypothetical protein